MLDSAAIERLRLELHQEDEMSQLPNLEMRIITELLTVVVTKCIDSHYGIILHIIRHTGRRSTP